MSKLLANDPRSVERFVSERRSAPVLLYETVKTELPDPVKYRGGLIYVSNEAGGATVAFSDGVVWRRAQDRAVVS